MFSAIYLTLFATTTVAARNFTVYNACPFTIWPAIYTDMNVSTVVPAVETGWEAPPWSVKSFNVPGRKSGISIVYVLIPCRQLEGWQSLG